MDHKNHIKVGVGAVVFKNDCVLLVKRKNPPHQDQWAIPGGKVHYGEALKQALKREILEETGITIEVREPVYTFEVITQGEENSVDSHYVVIDFNAGYVCGDVLASADAAAAAWVSREEFNTFDVNPITRTLLNDKFSFP